MDIQLLCGDALEQMAILPPSSVDAIITDLPYGTTRCKWDVIIPFEPMWSQVKRVLKPKGVFITTASQPFTSLLVVSNRKWFRYSLVWEKSKASGFLDARRKPLKAHEDICIFSKGLTTYNPQKTEGKPWSPRPGTKGSATDVYNRVNDPIIRHGSADGSRFPRSVIYFATAESEGPQLHSTQKPVDLYEWLVKTYTNLGDTVLDICIGSGTTGVACQNTVRNFIGIDNDPHWIDVTAQRLGVAL
jgi:site-specific DNA-methyltransferase (adenine-specific)